MTNYSERLDKILMGVWHTGYNRCNVEKNHPDGYDNYKFAIEPKQAKQAITSLIKELVAEAQPDFDSMDNYNRSFLEAMFKGFEQNLLKALEDK